MISELSGPVQSASALTALRRFGLGPRPGDLEAIRTDPVGALLQEIAARDAAVIADPDLPTTAAGLLQSADHQRARTQAVRMSSAGAPEAPAASPAPAMAGEAAAPPPVADTMMPARPPEVGPAPAGLIFNQEVEARLARIRAASVGFTEHLVMFWSNHFCISPKNGPQKSIAGSYEREAIRPHVLGRYVDMLRAVEQHPAMLIYLDNNISIGPNSAFARKKKQGLNENLAREILELHTLGVDGGYTQADVTVLARIITGWTVVPAGADAVAGGRFLFDPDQHEPGDQLLLGRVFPAGGVEQGEAALDFLAVHPATARHIARRFATYFVADDPPPALVDRLALSFRTSGGDLQELARVLVTSPEAWAAPAARLRTPQEFLFAALRLTGQKATAQAVVGQLTAMGQPLWFPGRPKGFPLTTDAWLSPAGLKARLDTADQIARSVNQEQPLVLADAAFGSDVSSETLETVRRAESRAQGTALVLMAPEFQRR